MDVKEFLDSGYSLLQLPPGARGVAVARAGNTQTTGLTILPNANGLVDSALVTLRAGTFVLNSLQDRVHIDRRIVAQEREQRRDGVRARAGKRVGSDASSLCVPLGSSGFATPCPLTSVPAR
jgi:hypothetical protein